MTEKTEAGQLVAVWKEDTGEGKDQTVLQLYRLPGGELVMHDRAHVLLMANEEAVNRYVEAWMEGTHAIPEYVRRVDAMDGNEPREIQLWETESEALYLVPVLNGIPMSKQAVVRYAWKGGLFARDAAEVSIGESACTTEADGRIVATWYPGGRIDIELRPGDLKLGTASVPRFHAGGAGSWHCPGRQRPRGPARHLASRAAGPRAGARRLPQVLDPHRRELHDRRAHRVLRELPDGRSQPRRDADPDRLAGRAGVPAVIELWDSAKDEVYLRRAGAETALEVFQPRDLGRTFRQHAEAMWADADAGPRGELLAGLMPWRADEVLPVCRLVAVYSPTTVSVVAGTEPASLSPRLLHYLGLDSAGLAETLTASPRTRRTTITLAGIDCTYEADVADALAETMGVAGSIRSKLDCMWVVYRVPDNRWMGAWYDGHTWHPAEQEDLKLALLRARRPRELERRARQEAETRFRRMWAKGDYAGSLPERQGEYEQVFVDAWLLAKGFEQ